MHTVTCHFKYRSLKQSTIILSLIILLAVACNHSDRDKNARIEPQAIEKLDLRTRLERNKQIIDNLFKVDSSKHLTFVKLLKTNKFISVLNDSLPADIETIIEMDKNSAGKVIIATEWSITESADWNILWTHYFDEMGRTFAFQRRVSFYNSGCTNGVAQETKVNYYNDGFQVAQEQYNLVDEKNRELTKDSCQFIHDYKHLVSADVNSYLKAMKIKNGM